LPHCFFLARLDDHGTSQPCYQLMIFIQIVYAYAHGHPLRQANPVEGRIDIGQQLAAGICIPVGNAA